MNWNVRAALIASVGVGMADSVWNGTVLASFCYDLGKGSNAFVGLVEAAMGLSQLFVALPVGAFADRVDSRGVTRKVKVTRLACPLILAAAGATSAVVYSVAFARRSQEDEFRWMLVGVMILWGLTGAVVMGPFQAMFADSVPTGDRSKYYSLLYAAYIGASAAGPAISVALFAAWGNTWSLRQLGKVLLSGMALEALAAPIFLAFRESALLGREADAAELLSPEEDDEKAYSSSLVPRLLFTSSLLSALGSGMTVKFFPLFFRETVGLTPIQVQAVYTLTPAMMVCGMGMAQLLHPRLGRVQTLCTVKMCAVGLLLFMIFLVSRSKKSSGRSFSVPLLVVVYVVRTALANCTYPIEESILMDFVPRHRRARWKSLESVATFGWCGSALIGGFVADAYSYETTFAVTAALQFSSAMLASTLGFIVPRHEKSLRRRHEDESREEEVAYNPLADGEEEKEDGTMEFGQADDEEQQQPPVDQIRILQVK